MFTSLWIEEEEKQFEIERAQAAARHAFSSSKDGGGRGGRGGRSRGGRGGGRGGRGGGDRRRDNNDRKAEAKGKGKQSAAEESTTDTGTGTKRRRAVEPDGGPDVGVRGNVAPPTIQSTKKAKLDDGSASAS